MEHTFIRFLLVGLMNTLVGLTSIYLLLHLVGLTYWPATFVGNSIGAIVSYFLNKTFTFHSQKAISSTWYRFIIVIAICYFIAYYVGKNAILNLLENTLDSDALFNMNDLAILVGTFFYTFLNYFGQKKFVFSK